jgi:hypothetical protein
MKHTLKKIALGAGIAALVLTGGIKGYEYYRLNRPEPHRLERVMNEVSYTNGFGLFHRKIISGAPKTEKKRRALQKEVSEISLELTDLRDDYERALVAKGSMGWRGDISQFERLFLSMNGLGEDTQGRIYFHRKELEANAFLKAKYRDY